MSHCTHRIASFIAVTGLYVLSSASFAANEDRLFSVKSAPAVLQALGADQALPGKNIIITMEAIAENPAVVPIEVESRIPGTERIAIVVDNNPTPLAAVYRLLPGTGATVSTRLKMRISSRLHVLVTANGKTYVKTQDVKVTEGGCGSPNYSAQDESTTASTAGQVMMRFRRNDDRWTVMGIFEHPMETGLRKIDQKGTMVTAVDKHTGRPIPPRYIREVTASVNGKPVLKAFWGPSIATDPQIGFDVRGKVGDQVVLAAIDNTGLKQGTTRELK